MSARFGGHFTLAPEHTIPSFRSIIKKILKNVRAVKTTIEYLDAVKDQLNLRSDNAISKALGISRATVSRYRYGICVFDDEVCFAVARILDVNPLEVIVAAHSDRARDAQEKARWATYWKDFSANFVVSRASCRDETRDRSRKVSRLSGK